MPLWAFMIGRARRSQLSDLSGSMPAGGASFRASSAMGTNAVPCLGRPRWAVGAGSVSSSAPPGPAVGDERLAPAAPDRRNASSVASGSPRASVTTWRRAVDGGVGRVQHPVALGRQHVVDPSPVALDRCAARPGPGPPDRPPRR